LADLDVILRNSQHLSKLIDDVLDLSQIEAEQIALTKERVSFRSIVEAAVTAVRPLFDSKGLWLKVEIPQGLPQIFCDPTRVRQVVLNLLSNAARFTEHGGVHLRVWQEGQIVIVSVADTGPGIAAEARDKIFQPFQQLDGSIRRRYGGSGLGLSISKSFIELHGGKIWLESEESTGTTFYFSLPIDPPTPTDGDSAHWLRSHLQYTERTHPSKAPVPIIRPRFLVLEEGHALQRLTTRYLNGAEIVPVASLQEAIQELSEVPALALLVNDTSVSEALQCLIDSTELPYGTPAIICSIPGIHEVADELGVRDYLVKPISRAALLGALDRLEPVGRTVLIIDDEPDSLRLFRRMLISSGCGYRILKASDGQQGMRILHEQQIDVILLDLVMPNMDGFHFLAEKDRDPTLRDIPVIVVSARHPGRQMVVGNALAVQKGEGISLSQLLACIQAISRILSTTGQAGGPALKQKLAD